jgi:hypothetical protein
LGNEAERIWEKYESKSREELFSNIPNPPISLSRPLADYAGLYKHPGFGTMAVEVREKKLQIDCTDGTWRFTFFLEHVSWESFSVKKTDLYSEETDTSMAQFEIEVDGTVRSFGWI